MATQFLDRFENDFARLSPEAQLGLLERLVHRVRMTVFGEAGTCESALAAMALDPQMQGDLRDINTEFEAAEADGLSSE